MNKHELIVKVLARQCEGYVHAYAPLSDHFLKMQINAVPDDAWMQRLERDLNQMEIKTDG